MKIVLFTFKLKKSFLFFACLIRLVKEDLKQFSSLGGREIGETLGVKSFDPTLPVFNKSISWRTTYRVKMLINQEGKKKKINRVIDSQDCKFASRQSLGNNFMISLNKLLRNVMTTNEFSMEKVLFSLFLYRCNKNFKIDVCRLTNSERQACACR